MEVLQNTSTAEKGSLEGKLKSESGPPVAVHLSPPKWPGELVDLNYGQLSASF